MINKLKLNKSGNDFTNQMGQREKFSENDLMKINKMYCNK